MSPSAFRILFWFLCAVGGLLVLDWYSAARLKTDLERADAQQHWASQEYEKSKKEGP